MSLTFKSINAYPTRGNHSVCTTVWYSLLMHSRNECVMQWIRLISSIRAFTERCKHQAGCCFSLAVPYPTITIVLKHICLCLHDRSLIIHSDYSSRMFAIIEGFMFSFIAAKGLYSLLSLHATIRGRRL